MVTENGKGAELYTETGCTEDEIVSKVVRNVLDKRGLRKMGIRHIDSIKEKKGALGRLDLMKKGLRHISALHLPHGYL